MSDTFECPVLGLRVKEESCKSCKYRRECPKWRTEEIDTERLKEVYKWRKEIPLDEFMKEKG